MGNKGGFRERNLGKEINGVLSQKRLDPFQNRERKLVIHELNPNGRSVFQLEKSKKNCALKRREAEALGDRG